MMIFFLYTVIAVFFIFMFIKTKGYKKEELMEYIDSKSILSVFVSLSAYLIDSVDGKRKIKKTEELYRVIDKVNYGCEVRKNTYIFRVMRINYVIISFIIVISIGYMKCIQETFNNHIGINAIERNKNGQGNKSVIINANYEGEEINNLELIVSEKKYSEDEAFTIIEKNYNNIIKKFLDQNDTVECIIYDLNLFSSYDDVIKVSWNIEEECIDYSGKINWDYVDKNKKVTIKCVLSVAEFVKEYSFEIFLCKEKRNKKDIIISELTRYIEEYSPYEKEIILPDEIDGKNIRFDSKEEKDSWLFIIIAIIIASGFYYAKNKELKDKMKKRQDELEYDYAALVNKIMILCNSGMSLISAWDKIIYDYDRSKIDKRYAYEEMKLARKRMKNGISESQAIIEFGKRCGLYQYIKFSNLIEQNVKKGTKGLSSILKQEINEAFEVKKSLILKKGDEAGVKLLLPMSLMLIISIIMIILPAFMSIEI